MDEAGKILGNAVLEAVRQVVREEIQAASNGNDHHKDPFLTPEELAEVLHVPLSWVYEQSRQGKIPTHHIGKYLRFNITEVLASQKKGDD